MRLRTLELEGITRYRSAVKVDFDAIGPGVVAIAGPNGAGKTTLLECCGPAMLFRELPTRSPSTLASWVDPKKGAKLALRFEVGGNEYDAKITISPKGETVAHLSRDGVPVVSGKVRDFDQYMAKLVGSKAAFYTSVFGAQGGRGRFAALGVADRKAVFRYYLGLDRVEAAHAKAKDMLKAMPGADETVRLASRVTMTERALADLVTLREGAEGELAEAITALALGKDASARLQALQKACLAVQNYEHQMEEVIGLTGDCEELEDNAPPSPEGDRPDLEAAERKVDAARDAIAKAQAVATAARTALANLQAAKREADEAKRRATLLEDVPCSGGAKFSGCKFLGEAVTARDSIPAKAVAVTAMEAKHAEAQAAAAEVSEADCTAKWERARDALAAKRKAAAEWDAAAVRASKHGAIKDAALANLARAKAVAKGLRAELPTPRPRAEDAPFASTVETAVEHVRKMQAWHDGLVTKVAVAKNDEQHQKDENAKLAKALSDAHLEALKRQPLELLVRALGPDGVQAFEIDAAGPRVSTLANELLTACYGGRFSLEVTTTKEVKSKPGTVAEDFSLAVYDAEREGVRSLEGLSGGEQVIVDAALRMALALFSVERTGTPMETLYQDETVGALDADNATRYVRMMHRARELGGFHQILYVTHDERAIATATAVVRVGADGSVKVEA